MISRKQAARGNLAYSWRRIPQKSRGLTLLELIIAFVVLQVALVIFAQFITKALDFSREVRRIEMAQILAQSKMEELIRTLPLEPKLATLHQDNSASRILNAKPGSFNELSLAQSEDVSPFTWIAETEPSADNPNLLNLTLHVYVIQTRTKPDRASTPIEDLFVSEDRERFNFTYSREDGSVEVMSGKEKLRISSAIALP